MLRQPPVLNTVSVCTFAAALLVQANLVECVVNIVISMLASFSTDFIHLALEVGLHGVDALMNKQVMIPLRDLVTSMYCLTSFTGQMIAFSWTGKFISSTWSFILVAFN